MHKICKRRDPVEKRPTKKCNQHANLPQISFVKVVHTNKQMGASSNLILDLFIKMKKFVKVKPFIKKKGFLGYQKPQVV